MTGDYVAGNDVRLLETGAEYFPALIEAINGASQEILLETYIFEPDQTGFAVSHALRDAALRGVNTRVLVDGFGGRAFASALMPEMAADGVEVLLFRRELRLFAFRRHRLRRLHRKLCVVDGRIAFVGGINIIDDMHTPGQTPPRFDYAVAVQGPLVAQIQHTMARLWRMMCWASFKRRSNSLCWVPPVQGEAGSIRARFVLRDNLRHRSDIENAYLAALATARRDAIIANAYFLPGRRFRRALVDAAARGVDVTLMLQGKVEYWLLHHACRALYPHLLAKGIRIVEYRKSFLHAKVAVIDDEWATVGSSNIDPFSLLLAREANLVVNDRDFVDELRYGLERAMAVGGVTLTAGDWERRPLFGRFLSWLSYGFVRFILGLIGFSRHH